MKKFILTFIDQRKGSIDPWVTYSRRPDLKFARAHHRKVLCWWCSVRSQLRQRIRQLRRAVECKGDTLTAEWLILAKTRIRGQFVKPSTFHLSQHVATQREDTDLLPSRAWTFNAPLRRLLRSRYPASILVPRPPAMYRRPPCDFRMDNAFQRDAAKSLSSFSLSLSLSRSRAWERAKKKVERPDLVDNVRISLSLSDESTMRERRGEKVANAGGKRVSIIINGPQFVRPLSAVAAR